MSDTLKKLHEPAALAAVTFAGLSLLAAVLNLLFPPSSNGYSAPFANRAHDEVTGFLSVTVAVAVAFAVHLANREGAELPRARLITLAALVEVAVAALFGVVSVLAQLGAEGIPGESKFSRLLEGAGGGAVIAVSGWYILTVWQATAPARPQSAAAGGWPGAGAAPGGPAYPQQSAPPPGGFGWTPQQPAAPATPVPNPPPSFGGDRTQVMPSVPQSIAPAASGVQPPLPPAGPPAQPYAPQPQPWSPGGASQPAPQQPYPNTHTPQDQRENPFPIGDWRSE